MFGMLKPSCIISLRFNNECLNEINNNPFLVVLHCYLFLIYLIIQYFYDGILFVAFNPNLTFAIFQQVIMTKDSESCFVTKVIQFSNS